MSILEFWQVFNKIFKRKKLGTFANESLNCVTAPAKRRKFRPMQAEEEEAAALAAAAAGAVWTPRPINDLKISSIYNRSATEAPAEVKQI